jgi:hypothetical protein
VSEEVCAVVRFELRQGIGGGLFECLEGSGGGLAHMRLELGEGIFDRIEVGTIGRQIEEFGAAGLNSLPDAGNLVGGQIVMTTMSPGRKVGPNICSIQARKHSPSIGPSRSIGATKPASVRPPTKVMVLQ